MAFKTILVHLDTSPGCEHRIAVACNLAQHHQAHLIGIAPSGIAAIPGLEHVSLADDWTSELQRDLNETAAQAVAVFDQYCQKTSVDSYESRQVGNSPIETVLLHARFCDLVILGQPGPDFGSLFNESGFVQSVMMGAGIPVLLIPHDGLSLHSFKQIVVGWDSSREATRAIRDSLPLLRQANRVEIIVVNPAKNTEEFGPDPGSDIALQLARHGVNVNVTQLKTSISVGQSLLNQANERGADLMVIGGYGHSRLHDFVLGSTTQIVLKSMNLPVLIAH